MHASRNIYRDKIRDNMAVQQCRCLQLPAVVLLFLLGAAAAAPLQGATYTHDSLQEVGDFPSAGVTRLCVVPLDAHTRLKVRHTDAGGGSQEVAVRKKSLPADTLSLLEIEVETDITNQPILSVRLNGTLLRGSESGAPSPRPAPTLPRTTLLLKGNARVTKCPEEESIVLGGETKPKMWVMTEGQQGEPTEGREGGEGVSSSASVPPTPTPTPNTAANATDHTGDPESGDSEPWWSFVLVLGRVGEVPVLVLLLTCLLVGVALGSVLVCLCAKICWKRQVEYVSVVARRTRSGQLAGDVVRDPKLLDTLSSRARSSGIGSTYSTLNTENGSMMGTNRSHGTEARPAGSTNNSMDRSKMAPTHIGVNNLGRGPNESPGSLMNQRRNNSSGNVLNIPYGNSVTRSISNRSTASWDNRDVDRSPRLAQDMAARTSSNRSTSSSINRNTNRSPNIPYTKKLGILAGHQDAPLLQQKPINRRDGSDEDSDDSSYDKPYVSSPIVAENYSVPHTSSAPVFVELQTTTSSSNDPNARQVPVYQFGTFKK